MTYCSGDIYEGEFKDNRMHGKGDICLFWWIRLLSSYNYSGKCYFQTGDVYEGTFKDDHLDGEGKFTFSNGETLEGEWEKAYLDDDEDEGEFELDAPEDITREVSRQSVRISVMNQNFRQSSSRKAQEPGDHHSDASNHSRPAMERKSSLRREPSVRAAAAPERRVSFKEEIEYAPPVYKSSGCRCTVS